MIWIGDRELSALFRVAAFLKKHIFYSPAHSYQPQTSQHRLALQALLHICRQFLIRKALERVIEKMVPHLSARRRPAKGDAWTFVANFSAETESRRTKRWLQWPLCSAFLERKSQSQPQHLLLCPSVSFASTSLQFWEGRSCFSQAVE